MPDIRPVDGWSPRLTLALLYPARAPRIDARRNFPRAIQETNTAAAEAKNRLRLNGFDLDWFRFEVMLCEYRQSVEGERQYPGRSIDSELKYLKVTEEYWGRIPQAWQPEHAISSEIWQVRQNIHPIECLGEYNGWDGPRDALGGFLNATGETWSDLLYEYWPPAVAQNTGTPLPAGAMKRREVDDRDRVRNLAWATLGKGAHEQSVASQ